MHRRRLKRVSLAAALAAAVLSVPPTAAKAASQFRDFWSCVPYARAISEVNLQGDAWLWWDAADGRYSKGQAPAPGAVLVFKRTRDLRRGHVAVVRDVVSSRKIIVDHANWGGRGRKGIVDRGIAVIDVSDANDWSAARVWYPPINDYGISTYATHGFIYPRGAQSKPAATLHKASFTGKPPMAGTAAVVLPERKPELVVAAVIPLRKPPVE